MKEPPNKGQLTPEQDFRSALRYYRVLSKMSKRQLAEETGRTLSYISALEGNSKYAIPDTKAVAEIAKALGLNRRQESEFQLLASLDRDKIEYYYGDASDENKILMGIVNEWRYMPPDVQRRFGDLLADYLHRIAEEAP